MKPKTRDGRENPVERIVAAYDEEAEATGWFGPEVVFGLAYTYMRPGETILDIGIGTGLGSALFRKAGLEVHGMDLSSQMLEACRSKGFTALQLHDLTQPPYPYEAGSMDHAVCTGVLHFFSDLSPIVAEAARILRPGGLFAFVVGDRAESEAGAFTVGAEHTGSERTVTMYLHAPGQIEGWMERHGFARVRDLAFTVFLDRDHTRSMQARAYLARKAAPSSPDLRGDGR